LPDTLSPFGFAQGMLCPAYILLNRLFKKVQMQGAQNHEE
jgi:hypothetical protein